ncbi:glycoside hydrolase family 20 protein [Streptomyces sp. NPDC058045]|uniref:beta-N-acetylhexosaminidase n=1 Tax=Streptomyces sp. NPDC058045 TaxID=3346311 RepID=UPI0036F0283C
MRRPAIVASAVVVVAAAAGISYAVWPEGDGGGDRASDRATVSSPQASPSPTRSYPLSKAPQTIPAVREHTAARGPGWKPAGGRVVVSDGTLADEGRLLAGELKLTYGGQAKAGAGDVELALDPKVTGGEAYSMSVAGGQVRITGSTGTGVFYGTRTLKQEVHGGGTAPEGVVNDRPAKQRRGMMLDIARKTYSESWIEDRIRELGDLKFNELGLHFSDDQGFRIESSSHPEIVSKDHLTKAQVRSLVKLAQSRHIQIVPEIDSPGHLGAVIDAHPELRLRSTSGSVIRGAVDISKPAAGALVDDLLKEYEGLFPGTQWHLGGDEYAALMVQNPAASFPQLTAAAHQKYGPNGTIEDLATGWLNDRAKAMAPSKRSLRAWNDGFFRGTSVKADPKLNVAYWTGKEIGARQPTEYLAEGRDVVNYNDEFMYYVLGQPQTFVYPTGERIYKQWGPRVLRDTTAVPAKYDRQILGGSFAIWGDIPNAQTQAQVAAGIRMPLRATVQKLWDPGPPALTWAQFSALAQRLG